MIQKNVFFLMLASIIALPATDAGAQDTYIVPGVVHTDDDKDRLVDDEVTGGQITVGRYVADKLAIEGVLGSHSMSGVDEIDLLELGVNGIYDFRRGRRFSPYLLAGVGMLDTDSVIRGDGSDTFFTYGVGVNVRFGEGPLALRLEYRARHVSDSEIDPRDYLTTLGLSYTFGGADIPAPAPAAAPDPDSDGDGVNDSRDRCPNTPAGHTVDASGCSLDSDGDGVVDVDDQCPNTYRGATVDARGCELDDDNDGVVNRLDKCPDTAEGVRVDINGCEIKDIIELPGVNFETNSDRLLPGAERVLNDAAATLRKYPDLVVEVAGHTDSVGAADYNLSLSERRAVTVRDYLINAGAAEAKSYARGYGEADPVADNGTSEGRAKNRRVELRIIKQ